MIAIAPNHNKESLTNRVIRELIRQCRAPRALTHCEFAERYIRMPSGPKKGERWSGDALPWARELFKLLDDPTWLQIVCTGPTQTGKTQQCLTIPTLRRIHQFPQNNIVLGFPDGDMIDKKFRTDFLPVLEASPTLRDLVPKSGAGSKGGKIKDTFTFGNGVVAALMSKGAKDEGKAGFTADYLAITEAGGFSEGTETSTETDPFRQLKGRLLAFDRDKRRVQIEGTVKVADMLPWSMRGRDDGPAISSQSRLLTPCPHCGEWICPEREHFVGWQGAETEDLAIHSATFVCPCCSSILTDHDREVSNRDLRVVHRGQTVDKNGDIRGDRPPTSTLWFRYSQWHNVLKSTADIAALEWEAEQTAEGSVIRDKLERALHQQTWCIPFVSSLTENERLDADDVAKRHGEWGRNVLPPDTEKVTVGVDLGKRRGWYAVIAWRSNGQRYVPAYGDFEVMPEGEGDVHAHIVAALKASIRPLVEAGFQKDGGGSMLPESVWIDGGYHPEAVAEFVRSCGPAINNRYRFCRGRGESVAHKWLRGMFVNRKKVTEATPYIGEGWFSELNLERRILEITIDADHWKHDVQDGARGGTNGVGKIVFYRPDRIREHDRIGNHIASTRYDRTFEPGKGEVDKWIKEGQDHLLDALIYATAAKAAVDGRLPGPVARSANDYWQPSSGGVLTR